MKSSMLIKEHMTVKIAWANNRFQPRPGRTDFLGSLEILFFIRPPRKTYSEWQSVVCIYIHTHKIKSTPDGIVLSPEAGVLCMISKMLSSKSLLMTMRKSVHLFAPIPTFCLKWEYKLFQADPVFHCLFTKSLQNSTSIGTIGWVYMLQIIKPVALINYSLFSQKTLT